VAKQTGPAYAVKGAFAVCAVAVALTACGSTWHNPHKSPQEAAADEKACAADSQDTALARAARQRENYGGNPPPLPGMNRGETPMQMRERVSTENTYNRQFEGCMKSKGYTQGKAEP
jgi:hypothetical protein